MPWYKCSKIKRYLKYNVIFPKFKKIYVFSIKFSKIAQKKKSCMILTETIKNRINFNLKNGKSYKFRLK